MPTEDEIVRLAEQLRKEQESSTPSSTPPAPPSSPDNDELSMPDYHPPDLTSPLVMLNQVRNFIGGWNRSYDFSSKMSDPTVHTLMEQAKSNISTATEIFYEGSEENLIHIPETLAVLEELQTIFEELMGALKEMQQTVDDDEIIEVIEDLPTPQEVYQLMRKTNEAGEKLANGLYMKLLRNFQDGTRDQQAMIMEMGFNLTLAKKHISQQEFSRAMQVFGNIGYKAADTLVFDVALFEDNIKQAINGETVGHAFSIAYKKNLYQNGESAGLARTNADAPQTNQSPSKRMHLASVSKPITTIVILRILQDLGLDPTTTKVAPYLPSDWTLGVGFDDLTFQDFFTHHTGFGQINSLNAYSALQNSVATDVGATTYDYSNANFGIMRVAILGLAGYDAAAYGDSAGLVCESAFLILSRNLYASINPSMATMDCTDTSVDETIQYNLPHGNQAGYEEPNRRDACGGIGWHLSSNELAEILTYLRNTEQLLDASMRKKMQDNFLGFMDPIDWSFVGGYLGVNYVHGGDWVHGTGELHSCIVAFPIQVEVALVINSERGNMLYQCRVLENAFDDAWVMA